MRRYCLERFILCGCCGMAFIHSPPVTHGQEDKVTVEIIVKKKEKASGEKKPAPDVKSTPFSGTRASVDVAILLDTSNSMDGLISQAKSQLWNIVQQFAEAKKNGQTPILRVSVFEYGNTNLPASEGYIRQACGLTDDLDTVSESLFKLSTNGGDEYCGQVIGEAVKRLDWSQETDGYKAIFIAGNEPFNQGNVDFRETCRRAIENGIVVNTIHCGDRQIGIRGQWEEGAKLAEGKYLNIDQDRTIVHIPCPQDKIILELNARLNATYLWFGSNREGERQNQLAQDENAVSMGSAPLIARAEAKSSSVYTKVGKDLVDSVNVDAELLSKVEDAELPESMRGLSIEAKKTHVEKMAAERGRIQAKLAKLTRERDSYLAAERATRAEQAGEATLGDAMNILVREQLHASGFEVPTP